HRVAAHLSGVSVHLHRDWDRGGGVACDAATGGGGDDGAAGGRAARGDRSGVPKLHRVLQFAVIGREAASAVGFESGLGAGPAALAALAEDALVRKALLLLLRQRRSRIL